jgi:hypothetical protein
VAGVLAFPGAILMFLGWQTYQDRYHQPPCCRLRYVPELEDDADLWTSIAAQDEEHGTTINRLLSPRPRGLRC